jgi:hypothetical protein
MFEKLRSREAVQNFKHNVKSGLGTLGLIHVEVEAETVPPEPYTAIIDGYSWTFRDEDTYLVQCAENTKYSCIVRMIVDENDQILSSHTIYNQPEIMEDMQSQGFGVVDESLEEAETNYLYFYETVPHLAAHEQASLN